VLFYIHGGGFNTGKGNFNGTKFLLALNKPLVFVTINYRLNGFGFMALEALSKNDPRKVSGNYGILDSIEALKVSICFFF
jgi:para-nitrobenzyl esterase